MKSSRSTSQSIRLLALLVAGLMLTGTVCGCQGGNRPTGTDPETTVSDPATNPMTDPITDPVTDPATEPETEPPLEDTNRYINAEKSDFACIVYAADSTAGQYAAYALRDIIAAAWGHTLPVSAQENIPSDANKPICLLTADQAVGNCGYAISAPDDELIIRADSLAGFDNAVKRLLGDTVSTETGALVLPKDYAVTEEKHVATDYIPEGDDYKPDYNHAPFYNDKNDAVAYVTNAMWHMFGAIDDGQSLVYRFGNEPTYYEWMSEKIMWSGNTGYINDLKGKLQSFPQVSTGYMWSWSSYPYWQVADTYCIHYDGTFRYISAVYDVISWENSTEFLSMVDGTTAGGEYADLDASKGRTVLEKVEAAWDYILYQLHGAEGYIQLTESSVYLNEDGSERFDYVKATGEYCWNNTGLPNSAASNYWDNLCFGNYDAYENALFYESLQAMIGIYSMLGGEYADRVPELEALAEKAKAKYDELYWSEETGRYIACIDTEGNRVDYGFTFLNFEALKYGLGDAGKAQSVFDWIDGRRTVEGDDRTGFDIMSYMNVMKKTSEYRKIRTFDPMLVLAPTVNTVAINNQENQKTGIVWWHGPEGINPFGSAAYGLHCENGGYIFYPVFYELMARNAYLGATSVTDRLAQIARVYEFNRLKSDAAASGSANWLEGLIGEFPESGLVPTVYAYGLIGLSAAADGLHVTPSFNDTYETMGVTATTYGGHTYGVEVSRTGEMKITCTDGVADMTLHYTPGRFTAYNVTITLSDGTTTADTLTVNADGTLVLELSELACTQIVLTPVLK